MKQSSVLSTRTTNHPRLCLDAPLTEQARNGDHDSSDEREQARKQHNVTQERTHTSASPSSPLCGAILASHRHLRPNKHAKHVRFPVTFPAETMLERGCCSSFLGAAKYRFCSCFSGQCKERATPALGGTFRLDGAGFSRWALLIAKVRNPTLGLRICKMARKRGRWLALAAIRLLEAN